MSKELDMMSSLNSYDYGARMGVILYLHIAEFSKVLNILVMMVMDEMLWLFSCNSLILLLNLHR